MSDIELAQAREDGIDDQTMVDIAAVVAENLLGNLINNLARNRAYSAPPRARSTYGRQRMNQDLLIERNSHRTEFLLAASRALVPTLRLIVITCADHRVDPAHVLGLGPSEAVVLRNPGGRVTSDILRSLMVLATVASVEDVSSGFDIVVMHHTDCGLSRLTDPEHEALIADFVGVDEATVKDLALDNPVAAVRYDVERLRSVVSGPDTTVAGLIYDVESGVVYPC